MQLELRDVSYSYGEGGVSRKNAVDHVSVTLDSTQFVGLIGHTGSGKSTLVQMLNGLLKPAEGEVYFEGQNVHGKDYKLRDLRRRVGLVFQYPEYQLFEETVLKDVCFGPKNLGCTKEEQEERSKRALALVGLGEEYYDQSPFEMSGGQKRRVAIAGILAMEPDFLVLDEPTAGLDPQGRDEILEQIAKLNREAGIGVVLVSHSMEDVANYASRVLVMAEGKIRFDGTPRDVFAHYKEMEQIGLSAPQVTYITEALREKGFDLPKDLLTVSEAADAIYAYLQRNKAPEQENTGS